MARTKANNQYYGKYFECCVVNQINNENVDLYKETFNDFTDEERKEILEDAKKLANYLKVDKAEYIGNHTVLASGDIYLPLSNEYLELKYVSTGNGTYWNTSLSYFEKFGFNIQEYFKKFGLIQALEDTFGTHIQIKTNAKSPVSMADSSLIRYNYKDEYETKIKPIDEQMRKAFVSDLAIYFQNNPDKTYELVNDILLKNSMTTQKSKPDRLIIYNYTKKTIKELNWNLFYKNQNDKIRATNKGLMIGDIRIAIGWQNGNGLNNPTLRAFI